MDFGERRALPGDFLRWKLAERAEKPGLQFAKLTALSLLEKCLLHLKPAISKVASSSTQTFDSTFRMYSLGKNGGWFLRYVETTKGRCKLDAVTPVPPISSKTCTLPKINIDLAGGLPKRKLIFQP